MAVPNSTVRLCSNPLGGEWEWVVSIDGENLFCENTPWQFERFRYYECSNAGVVVDVDYYNASCPGGTWTEVTESITVGAAPTNPSDPGSFDPSTLDPVLLAAFTGVGFFFLLPLWAAAFGVKMLLKNLIK